MLSWVLMYNTNLTGIEWAKHYQRIAIWGMHI